MLADLNYLLRSNQNGQYIVARPRGEQDRTGFLLLFSEQSEALSYVNTHAGEVRDRFTVEAVTKPQLRDILNRWKFQGVGRVKDPLIPDIEFLVAE
ncbi:hypothetical protein PN462_04640 [Spirulina sp. CS-785/01]|uniref:hypothetical protein n=1 Tax=Spirulina sp. CS-785/01 TaxID=3021716 RepID=UPI00232F2CF3|nr:hypothetical protein [Spirulina sp. CS-785/01]MDB9312382.1 hypothetical protein [Spirulina sp. CS-785/01]